MDTQFIVDAGGVKKAVVLSIEDYKRLLEDLHDLAVIAERKEEPSVDLKTLKERLTQDV